MWTGRRTAALQRYSPCPTRTDGITFDGKKLTVPANLAEDAEITITATYTTEKGDSVTTEIIVTALASNIVQKYKVTVTGADGVTGSGEYREGDIVRIAAPSMYNDESFDHLAWTAPVELNLNDAYADETTFTMPPCDVAVEAVYGCYVATAVYGSYDCPEIWTLRRFRDKVLART